MRPWRTAATTPDDHLVLGGCDTTALAKEFGTPLYVFDAEELRGGIGEYRWAFTSRYENTLVVYASKAYLGRWIAALVAEEGLGSIHTRHRRIGDMTRREIKALGLELFCEDERFASDTVTAIKAPEGIDVSALRTMMEDEHDTIIAGGQAKLSGKIFRIGHLGLVDEDDIRLTMDALAHSLEKLGFTRPTA